MKYDLLLLFLSIVFLKLKIQNFKNSPFCFLSDQRASDLREQDRGGIEEVLLDAKSQDVRIVTNADWNDWFGCCEFTHTLNFLEITKMFNSLNFRQFVNRTISWHIIYVRKYEGEMDRIRYPFSCYFAMGFLCYEMVYKLLNFLACVFPEIIYFRTRVWFWTISSLWSSRSKGTKSLCWLRTLKCSRSEKYTRASWPDFSLLVILFQPFFFF